MEGNYSSALLQSAVEELSRLPGIGKKTALRLALHLLKQPVEISNNLGNALVSLRNNIKFCKECNNISDSDICEICGSPKRDHATICVVEDIRDMLAIENTNQFRGVYHVLGGIISPVDGIGPSDLNIDKLIKRVAEKNIAEVIMALPATVEGDTTNYYLYKVLHPYNIQISIIARGIPVGDELDYTDEITLGRSLIMRHPYTQQ